MERQNVQLATHDAIRVHLVDGPKIDGHIIQHSDTHHLLIIDGAVVSCTPTEYPLLMQMLRQGAGCVSFRQLVEEAFQSALTPSTRRSLTQHMSRVRAKLWPFGFDILCIIGYGYMLLATSPDQTSSPSQDNR